jgi:hypothetical protein
MALILSKLMAALGRRRHLSHATLDAPSGTGVPVPPFAVPVCRGGISGRVEYARDDIGYAGA